MRIIIDNIATGRKYGEIATILENTMHTGRPVAAGEFSRVDLDEGDLTITVEKASESEPNVSFLPWRVGKRNQTGAAFATKEQALAFLGVLLTPPFDETEELSIWFSLEVV